MSSSTSTYILTTRILGKIQAEYLKAFEDVMVCAKCGTKIRVGQKIESRRKGSGKSNRRHRSFRHVKCLTMILQ